MDMKTNQKVLLSSVCRPFGEKYGDAFCASYEGSFQVMWAQGIFRTRATTTQWGLDFIACNLKTPTVVLQYPSMSEFVSEIKKGYDYVGIAFIPTTLHKMRPMIAAVRRYAPATKIVLGGYGAVLGDELKPYADYICQGEGVAFMRRLLKEPVDRPIQQPVLVQNKSLFSIKLPKLSGYIFAGLGCPNGCDFCLTSHFFKRKHIKFLPDGASIVRAIEKLREIHPDMTSFYISDEDFLLNKERGVGFLHALRKSNLPPLSISVFSSVKALSQYKTTELVEMGIDFIWVGFEGKRSGYKKREGRSFSEMVTDFRRHGINVLASMIVGLDYQTPEIIAEEFAELIKCKIAMFQCLIYAPAIGTPLYERLKAEGRMDETLDYQKGYDAFSLVFKHPHIGKEEMSSIQRGLYHAEFEKLGPSAFRMVENWLAGYKTLRDHPVRRVRQKAAKCGLDARSALPLLNPSKRYVNPEIAQWIEGLRAEIIAQTGPLTPKEKLLEKIVPFMLWFTDFKMRHDLWQQPKPSRMDYNIPSKESRLRSFGNPFRLLHLRDFFSVFIPPREKPQD